MEVYLMIIVCRIHSFHDNHCHYLQNSARKKLNAVEFMWLGLYCWYLFLIDYFSRVSCLIIISVVYGNRIVIEFPKIVKSIKVWTNEIFFHGISGWCLNDQAICLSIIHLLVVCFDECFLSILLRLILLYWNSSMWNWVWMWIYGLAHSELLVSSNSR